MDGAFMALALFLLSGAAYAAAIGLFVAIRRGPGLELRQRSGEPALDERLGGYSVAEVLAYLDALGPAGIAIYRNGYQRLDRGIAPLCVVATTALLIAITIGLSSGDLPDRLAVAIMLLIASVPVLPDVWENWAIRRLLDDPDGITVGRVRAASIATVLKGPAYMVHLLAAMLWLCVAGFLLLSLV